MTGTLRLGSKYILGGHDAKPAEFPHMGAIGWKSVEGERVWKFQCGCALISPKFALSAAHCSQADPRDMTIADINPNIVRFGVEDILGQTSWDRLPADRLITKIIVHPKYASPKKYFDLALFELNIEITFTSFVQPACLWNGGVEQSKHTTITGWGDTAEGSHKGAPFLQVASVGIVDFETCDSLLKRFCNRLWCGLQDHQFCAGQLSGGVDSCQGDSGGPLQMKIPLPAETKESMHYLIGVTSFGFGCGRANTPGVYTKVAHFLDWIESVVWN
ncbi:serine protease snake-like [Pectinophora gossypiella]|uniref:serine protease snake-like n=1 Tax=Pectinophora gossypiella TaxID=13191 RepID=UPI00214EAD37|nr:serine protease snake-like [Pectinophora gossypiella]